MKFSVFQKGQKVNGTVPLKKCSAEEIGIFETLRVYDGRIFRLEEHLLRLRESAKTSGFLQPLDGRHLRKELEMAIAAFGKKDAFLRLTLIGDEMFVMMGERKHPEALYKKGVELRTSPVRRSLSNAAFPEAKTTGYQNAVMASLEPKTGEIYEWIFLDRNDYVTEVRVGNLFMIKASRKSSKKTFQLLTPPLVGILNGVTRRFVIECARCCRMPVAETPLTRHDVFNADEVFLTNTSWEILPVRTLDGRPIGRHIPGPETLKLHRVFKQRIAEECQISSSAVL